MTTCSHCGGTGEEPLAEKPGKALVVRNQQWVSEMVQSMTESSWTHGRARKEAMVAFNFHRWRHGIKTRVIFSPKREKHTAKLVEAYGLIRVMLAIEGQMVHPDFNHSDTGRTYHGYDNLIRIDKGFENVEKCSELAIQQGRFDKVLATLARLEEKRGWTPGEADVELFETLRANGRR